jgi:hypothetical protein
VAAGAGAGAGAAAAAAAGAGLDLDFLNDVCDQLGEDQLGEVAVPGMGMDSLQEWDLPDL